MGTGNGTGGGSTGTGNGTGGALFDPADEPITEEEVAHISAIAPTVKVTDLRLYGRLTHLSPATLHRLMFGFASIQELTLYRFNGNQLTDEHLHECGRRQIWRLRIITKAADAGPLAVSDEGLLDFLYAPEHGTSKRKVVLTAFNASPQFAQKLLRRARLAADVDRVDMEVQRLPLGSQQLDGLQLTVCEDATIGGKKEAWDTAELVT
ncbi:hypothetical protein AAVH_28967 [Aphelenchoides avenae]|nr:hypothetical protein AAVH_28967 [Aphelenchus avenae]